MLSLSMYLLGLTLRNSISLASRFYACVNFVNNRVSLFFMSLKSIPNMRLTLSLQTVEG